MMLGAGALIGVLCCASLSAWAAPRLEQIVPKNTIAAVSVSDIDLLTQRFKGTALYHIWTEPEVRQFMGAFLGAMNAQWKKFQRDFEGRVGPDFRNLLAELGDGDTAARYEKARADGKSSLQFLLDETRAMFSGPVGIAITDLSIATGKPQVVALVAWNPMRFDRARMAKWVRLLEKAVEKAARQRGQQVLIERKTIANHDVALMSSGADKTLYYAICDEMLLLANSEEAVRVALTTTPGSEETLAASPIYKHMCERFGAGRVDVIGYLNVARLLDEAAAETPPAAQMAFDASGFRSVRPAGMGIVFDGPAIRSTTYIDAPGERRGVLSLFEMKPVGPLVLDHVPKEAVSCFCSRIDIPRIWEVIDSMARSTGDASYAKFQQAVASAEAQLMLNIRDDLFGLFGDTQVGFVLGPTSDDMMRFGQAAMLLSVSNPERARTNLGQLANAIVALVGAKAPPQFMIEIVDSQYRKYDIQSLNLPNMQMLPLSPSYAVTEKYLVMGLTPESVKAAIDQINSSGPSIRSKPDFQRALSRLPSQYSALSYRDVKSAFEWVYSFLPMALNLAAAKGGVPLDVSMLPPADTISKHLFGAVSCMGHNEQGIFFESYSPGVTSVVMAAVGALAVVKATQSKRHPRVVPPGRPPRRHRKKAPPRVPSRRGKAKNAPDAQRAP